MDLLTVLLSTCQYSSLLLCALREHCQPCLFLESDVFLIMRQLIALDIVRSYIECMRWLYAHQLRDITGSY